jgi:hypothetical protein
MCGEAERLDDTSSVGRCGAHPHIEIDRGPWVAVKPYGIAANEQVVNAVRVEQSQELFEVGRQ